MDVNSAILCSNSRLTSFIFGAGRTPSGVFSLYSFSKMFYFSTRRVHVFYIFFLFFTAVNEEGFQEVEIV